MKFYEIEAIQRYRNFIKLWKYRGWNVIKLWQYRPKLMQNREWNFIKFRPYREWNFINLRQYREGNFMTPKILIENCWLPLLSSGNILSSLMSNLDDGNDFDDDEDTQSLRHWELFIQPPHLLSQNFYTTTSHNCPITRHVT